MNPAWPSPPPCGTRMADSGNMAGLEREEFRADLNNRNQLIAGEIFTGTINRSAEVHPDQVIFRC